MTIIPKIFPELKKRNPFIGDIPLFASLVTTNDKPLALQRNFRKFVDPNDYAPKDEEEIMEYLIGLIEKPLYPNPQDNDFFTPDFPKELGVWISQNWHA